MIIRPEKQSDIAAIAAVTKSAFLGHAHSDQSEPQMIDRFRRSGALSLSLVAETDGRIVGHVAFTPITVSGGSSGWFGLGPLSVSPDRQGQGIGNLLVQQGLRDLKAMRAEGCVLIGEPGYYSRFGFKAYPGLQVADVPAEYFLALPLQGSVPSGIVTFHWGYYGEQT